MAKNRSPNFNTSDQGDASSTQERAMKMFIDLFSTDEHMINTVKVVQT
jgi:hypothetical protein